MLDCCLLWLARVLLLANILLLNGLHTRTVCSVTAVGRTLVALVATVVVAVTSVIAAVATVIAAVTALVADVTADVSAAAVVLATYVTTVAEKVHSDDDEVTSVEEVTSDDDEFTSVEEVTSDDDEVTSVEEVTSDDDEVTSVGEPDVTNVNASDIVVCWHPECTHSLTNITENLAVRRMNNVVYCERYCKSIFNQQSTDVQQCQPIG